ncbi:MAG: extracellular solute-binding protein, partial [Firmicutes bacterium]|nr:extracellular solute-binding protein [Bacillota bacterium]
MTIKKTLCILLMVAIMLGSACGPAANHEADKASEDAHESSKEELPAEKEVVTIRFGHHNIRGLDPAWRDPVTGEPHMSPEQLRAREKAVEAVLKEHHVKFEFIEYPSNVREILLQSVMANDPVADIVWMFGGSQSMILAQNVLQPLDDYQSLFEDEEYAWMLLDKMFGKHYFLNGQLPFIKSWPLVYNIQCIEAVDALKEDGETVYPTDLWKRGEWTFSRFESYLEKIEAFYSNSQAPNRPERRIRAYETDYRYATLDALSASGAEIFGENGLGIDTPEAIGAAMFMDQLMSKGLMWTDRRDENLPNPGWTWNSRNFANGETVFTNCAKWMIKSAANKAAERGQSVGIVPFPRPDHLSADDPAYRQTGTIRPTAGILKGVSKERTELAVKSFRTFFSTYFKALAGTETVSGYKEKYLESEALNFGLDIFHEKTGPDILEAFGHISDAPLKDTSLILGLYGKWSLEILGKSLYGLDSSPKYDVAVKEKAGILEEQLGHLEAILKSDKINDNVKPKIEAFNPQPLAFPVGTNPADLDFSELYTASDNIDGPLDFSTVALNYDG